MAGTACLLLDEYPLCTYRNGDWVGVTVAGVEEFARDVSLGESRELMSMAFCRQYYRLTLLVRLMLTCSETSILFLGSLVELQSASQLGPQAGRGQLLDGDTNQRKRNDEVFKTERES